MDSPHWCPVARPAAGVRKVEYRLCAVPPLGFDRSTDAVVSTIDAGIARPACRHGGRHIHQGASARRRFPKSGRPPGGEAIGRGRGGLTTKILAATDKNGNLIRYLLLPGNAAESPGLVPLTDGIATSGSVVIADKAFDSDNIRKSLAASGIITVIPSRVNRRHPYPLDKVAYKTRHLVENYFARIKQFRRIATRYEKTDTSFAGMLDLVATVIAIR